MDKLGKEIETLIDVVSLSKNLPELTKKKRSKMSEVQMLSLKSELVGKLEFYNKMLKTLTELDANIKLLEKKIQNEKSN